MINNSLEINSAAFDTYYMSPRRRLMELLPDSAPRRALEIGCGAGANLHFLKLKYPSIETFGVEIRPEAAEVARKEKYVDNIYVADLLAEDAPLFDPGMFDVIIMSHVLEHFPKPELVIHRALTWLNDTGRLLIALPNVRHISVLLKLVLKGDFKYEDSGILDRTHLRFFTRKSATRFLEENGLSVEKIETDIVGSNSVRLSKWSAGIMDDFASHAYNFVTTKKRSL